MTTRAGEQLDPCCARLHAQHEAEKAALRRRIAELEDGSEEIPLRLRITVLEAALERERETVAALIAQLPSDPTVDPTDPTDAQTGMESRQR